MPSREKAQPKILVSDACLGSAIAIIRSLGRRGWYVIAADSDPRSPGLHSRYAQERLVYPPPETAPREMVKVMLDAARDKKIDLIIPVTDAVILPLSEARSCFDRLCKLALPDPAALDVVTDKFKTLELAERLGVPTPRTRLVSTTREALEYGQTLGWPVVLKPQRSRLYHNQTTNPDAIEKLTVCYAHTSEQLAEQMQPFEGRCPVLLQEYCPGIGYGVELLMHRGRSLAAFQHKRLREIPVNGGASSFRQSVPLDPTLYGYAMRLLPALKWTGLAMVEFKVGANGPKLMEINGRIWGSLPLALHSGMDFPRRMVELYLYGAPSADLPPDMWYAVGVHARNLELDLMWIASVLLGRRRYPFLKTPPRYQALLALIGLLNPVTKFDVLSLEDPQPGLYEIRKILNKFGKKMKEAR